MALSGILTLTDLNDFITPSQACIKPVEQTNVPEKEAGAASTEIRVDSRGLYYEADTSSTTRPTKQLKPAQISLNDCLACSGCITSAESVLITMQSHTEVLSVLSSNPPPGSAGHKVPILSVSPQSLASISAKQSNVSDRIVSPVEVFRSVKSFALKLGFEHVFDTTFARHLALEEHLLEFKERQTTRHRDPTSRQLPMLASACPGWICYAEKTHSEMLPFISRTKSPQQIMGTLVKEWLAPQLDRSPSDVYHVTVMPCYDKKLEASRQDFYNDIFSTRDVDCVVTTGELELLLEAKEEGLGNQEWAANKIVFPEFLSHPGSSSGSYLHSIIDSITSEVGPWKVTLETRTIRSDYEDLILRRIDSEEVLFKGAKCYGFRNLQNMVRKLGKETGVNIGSGAAGRAVRRTTTRNMVNGMGSGAEKRDYDYVEIMACPGGCVNGGGQLTRPPGFLESSPSQEGGTGRWGDKEWMGKVEGAYWDGEAPSDGNEPYHEADLLSREIRAALQATDGKREPFRTDYRRVESEVVGLAVQW